MSFTVTDIPEKKVPSEISETSLHDVLDGLDHETSAQLSKLCVEGHSHLYQLIKQKHEEATVAVNKIQNEHIADCAAWVGQYNETCQWLLEHIKVAATQCVVMDINLKGFNRGGRCVEPTKESWLKHNPGRVAAIEFVFQKLRLKGWSPIMGDISKVDYDRDDSYYSGGTLLNLKCDFSQPQN